MTNAIQLQHYRQTRTMKSLHIVWIHAFSYFPWLKLFHITLFFFFVAQSIYNDSITLLWNQMNVNDEHCIHRATIKLFTRLQWWSETLEHTKTINSIEKRGKNKFTKKKRYQSKQTLSGLIGTLVHAVESTIQSNAISSKATKRTNDLSAPQRYCSVQMNHFSFS